jgi:hypothetical protein
MKPINPLYAKGKSLQNPMKAIKEDNQCIKYSTQTNSSEE